MGYPGGSSGKESACNDGDWRSIPGLGRSPGEENDYLLQYSCLKNPMVRGVWWAAVHGVIKSQTWLSNKAHTHTAAAKSLQSCPTLCDPTDGSPLRLPRPWGSPGKNPGVGCHFLLQCMKVKSESEALSHVRPSATPWTAAYQAPPPMGFSRQEYWSGVPLPSPHAHRVPWNT